jgi:hypothetical protein
MGGSADIYQLIGGFQCVQSNMLNSLQDLKAYENFLDTQQLRKLGANPSIVYSYPFYLHKVYIIRLLNLSNL